MVLFNPVTPDEQGNTCSSWPCSRVEAILFNPVTTGEEDHGW
jgi:hypothetical protein